MTTPFVDITDQLPRSAPNQARWLVQRAPATVTYDFVHYTAEFCDPASTQAQEIAKLAGDARYHINKDWSTDHSGVHGWCLMYHWAIGPSGTLYRTNDVRDVLWNTTYGNPVGVATVLLLGPGQAMTPAMEVTLRSHLGDNEQDTSMRIIRQRTFGHGECAHIYGQGPDFGNDTNCPGMALDWVRAYRTSPPAPPTAPESRFFPETGHYIGHGFKDRWEACEKLAISGTNMALMLIGYPISEEYPMVIGGQAYTVQDFQRARMEFHPENHSPYDVLFGLVNSELLAARASSAPGSTAQDH